LDFAVATRGLLAEHDEDGDDERDGVSRRTFHDGILSG
jgi:hypothetical protein